jgi:hypothetical protein
MDLGSGIRKKPIPDPGSRGQKGTGSRIRIRNTEILYILLCVSIIYTRYKAQRDGQKGGLRCQFWCG